MPTPTFFGAHEITNMSRDDAISVSGFDFELAKAPLYHEGVDGVSRRIEGKSVLSRTDNHTPVSIVGDRFHVVQPADIFDFFGEAIDRRGWTMQTAGVCTGSTQYWALARTGIDGIVNGDAHTCYCFLATACDGSLATVGKLTNIRTSCNNAIMRTIRTGNGALVKMSHRRAFDAKAMANALGMSDIEGDWDLFRKQMEALGKVEMSSSEASEFFHNLLRPAGHLGASTFGDLVNGPRNVKESLRSPRGFESLLSSYYHSPGSVPGSAYGVLQGVTHWIDHGKTFKDESTRINSAVFGAGERTKQLAFEELLSRAYA